MRRPAAAADTDSDSFVFAQPTRLFRAAIDAEQVDRQCDVAPDGSFLIDRRGADTTEPITVVLGFDRLLEPQSNLRRVSRRVRGARGF